MIVELLAGTYSVIIQNSPENHGIALLEIYDVPLGMDF